MKLESIKNGKELKKWREKNNIPRHKFAAAMDKAVGTILTIENTGRVLDENFLIVFRSKYK